MAETEQQQDSSKTLVAFVVGLLIGGMLVWAFSGPSVTAPQSDIPAETTDEASDETTSATDEDKVTDEKAAAPATPKLEVGDGVVEVTAQPAGISVKLDRATYPVEEGWIGVRDYDNGQLGFIKGVVRFSAAAGLVPQDIVLQLPTQSGQEYAVVMFTEDGDNVFNPAGDVQIDQIFATFTAQ